jgi:hypothetical protein
MLIAVEPADLIVVDVAARRDRAGATGAHRGRPASCGPSGAQLRTGPPAPGSAGCHRRTPSQASRRPVCQPLEASPPGSTQAPRRPVRRTVRGPASRAAPARSRTSDLSSPTGSASQRPPIFACSSPQQPGYQLSSQVRHGVRVNAKSYGTPQRSVRLRVHLPSGPRANR